MWRRIARKFSLVKIPILGYGGQCFSYFFYGEKNVAKGGALVDLAKG